MAEYQLAPDTTTGPSDMIIRVADQAWIPNDPANTDRMEYNKWLGEGNVPDPAAAPPPPPPPDALAAYQFWAQAAISGKITEAAAVAALNGNLPNTIDQMINNLPSNQRFRAKMLFRASIIPRLEPLIATKLQQHWSINIDEFFKAAILL